MITKKTIKRVVDDIVREIKPHKVILFGSYARGTQTPDSDLDVFVIASLRGTAAQRIRRVRNAVTINGFGLDVVVRSPRRVKKALEGRDWFVQEILAEGKVLYERRH
jgi:predicted nucleotidyltransferase